MKNKGRTQTVSTGFTNMRPSHGIRSVHSVSSMSNMATPISNLGSRGTTPYQAYKVAKRNKRKIFTNQLVHSKNKVPPAVHGSHFEDIKSKLKIFKQF